MENTAVRRVQLLQNMLAKKKIDAALLINTVIKDPNILYFTGLDLEYSFLLVPKKGEPTFLVSPLEYERAKCFASVPLILSYKKPVREIKKLLKGKSVAINEL